MENMDTNPEVKKTSGKPSKTKALFAAVLAVLLVLGGVYYFVFGQKQVSPPTLGSGSGTYQGLIQTGKYKFLTFSDAEKTAWSKPADEHVTLDLEKYPLGMFTVFSDTDTTVKELVNALDHETTEDFMVAMWDNSDDSWVITENNFYTSPQGLSYLTEQDFGRTIPAYKGVVLFTKKTTKLYGENWHLAGETDFAPEKGYDFCSGNAGWTNAVASKNLPDQFKECVPDNVFQWVEPKTGAQDYEELNNFMDIKDLNGSKLLWVYYEKAPGTKKYEVAVQPEVSEQTPEGGCDKYTDPEKLIDTMQTAVADMDFATLYCTFDKDTQKVVDEFVGKVRNVSSDLKVKESLDEMEKLLPEILKVHNDKEQISRVMQFFEAGTADEIYKSYDESGDKDDMEKTLTALKGLAPVAKDLVSTQGDTLEYLTKFSKLANDSLKYGVKVKMTKDFFGKVKDALKLIKDADIEMKVKVASNSMMADVLQTLNEKGEAEVVVTVKPDGEDKIEINLQIIKDQDGYLSVYPTELYETPVKVRAENGKESEIKGLNKISQYYGGKLEEFAKEEETKFTELPASMGKFTKVMEKYANAGDIKQIVEGFKVFAEYAEKTGGKFKIEEYEKTASENGLAVFNSNAYPGWYGGFYGEPARVTQQFTFGKTDTTATGIDTKKDQGVISDKISPTRTDNTGKVYNVDDIVYVPFKDTQAGVTDYFMYFETGQDYSLWDLFSDKDLILKLATIKVGGIANMDKLTRNLDFFTRDGDTTSNDSGVKEGVSGAGDINVNENIKTAGGDTPTSDDSAIESAKSNGSIIINGEKSMLDTSLDTTNLNTKPTSSATFKTN